MRRDVTEVDLAANDRGVLPWRLVVGVALHVVVPAYLVALGAAWVMAGPTVASGEALLAFAAGVSWRFCLGYSGLTLAAAIVARLLDPALRRRRDRREADDPVAAAGASDRRVARAITQAERIGGAASAAASRVRMARWDHGDERCRAIAADLARAVNSFATAHASAAPARRAEIATLAAAALRRVAVAVDDLADERARLDEGDALTHAAYLSHRYASSTLDPAGPGEG